MRRREVYPDLSEDVTFELTAVVQRPSGPVYIDDTTGEELPKDIVENAMKKGLQLSVDLDVKEDTTAQEATEAGARAIP